MSLSPGGVNGLMACLLLLVLTVTSPASLASVSQESAPLPKSATRYFAKASEVQQRNPRLARLYADSMAMAAGAAGDSAQLSEALKLIGDLCVQQANYTQAISWFHKGLELANRQRNRSMVARMHNSLGGVYLKTSQYDKALSQFNKAYSLGRSQLSPAQKASIVNNLGIIHRHLKQYPLSELYLQEALQLYEEANHALGVGKVYNNLGLLAKQRGQLKEARVFFTKAKQTAEAINRPAGIAYALNNLAEVYLEEADPKAALSLLRNSITLKKQLHDLLGLTNSHQGLGQAWLMLQQPDSALLHYGLASRYADTIQNVSQKIEALTGIANAYALKGRSDVLPQLYTRILSLKDSSFHQERAAQLAMALAESEMNRKEGVIEELTQEAEETSSRVRLQELLLYLSLPLLITVLVLAVFYLLRYRSERKAHHELQLRHEEIHQQKARIEEQHQTIQHQNQELQAANKLVAHYNNELQEVNNQLEDKIRERTRALSDTYRKLAFHINNTPLAVLEWNKQLELVRWPEQAERIFGYSAQQVLGQQAGSLPFLQDVKHRHFIEKIRNAGDAPLPATQVSFQQELRKADGDAICVEWSHSVLADEKGQVESVLSIANDVSLREQAFQEISLINQELDTFIYKASHDLRGPIARMQGIINLGKIESADPIAHFYFDLLHKVSNELNNLLLRLLMVHNIHQHLLCMETIPFKGFVDSLIYELPSEKKNSRFTFYNSIPEGLCITSDRNLLSIILVNLLDNSLTFADHDKPYVIITASVLPGNKLQFSVQDNGPGISENLHEKVFDMFFQGSTKSTGVGLGLYMVRKAVRKFGGEVRLERRDELTIFTVVLPESDLMRIVPAPVRTKVALA